MTTLKYCFFGSLVIFNFFNFALSLETEQVLEGKIASTTEFRFTCALTYYNRPQCTCFILGNKWIGTAAHCVTNPNNNAIVIYPFKVVAGLYDLSLMNSAPQAYVKNIYVLKKYTQLRDDLDFSLLELREILDLQKDNLKSLIIPSKDNPIYKEILNHEIKVAGFGYDYVKVLPKINPKTQKLEVVYKDIKKKLSYIEAKVIDGSNCCVADYLGSDGLMCVKTVWKENQLTKGLCKGDSGTVVEFKGYALLVSSSGQFLNDDRLYQKHNFVKLGNHKDWIEDVMAGRPDYNKVNVGETLRATKKSVDDSDYEDIDDGHHDNYDSDIDKVHLISKRSVKKGPNQKLNPNNKPTSTQTNSNSAKTVPAKSTSSQVVPKQTNVVAQQPLPRNTVSTNQATTLSPLYYKKLQEKLDQINKDSCIPLPASKHQCKNNINVNVARQKKI